MSRDTRNRKPDSTHWSFGCSHSHTSPTRESCLTQTSFYFLFQPSPELPFVFRGWVDFRHKCFLAFCKYDTKGWDLRPGGRQPFGSSLSKRLSSICKFTKHCWYTYKMAAKPPTIPKQLTYKWWLGTSLRCRLHSYTTCTYWWWPKQNRFTPFENVPCKNEQAWELRMEKSAEKWGPGAAEGPQWGVQGQRPQWGVRGGGVPWSWNFLTKIRCKNCIKQPCIFQFLTWLTFFPVEICGSAANSHAWQDRSFRQVRKICLGKSHVKYTLYYRFSQQIWTDLKKWPVGPLNRWKSADWWKNPVSECCP